MPLQHSPPGQWSPPRERATPPPAVAAAVVAPSTGPRRIRHKGRWIMAPEEPKVPVQAPVVQAPVVEAPVVEVPETLEFERKYVEDLVHYRDLLETYRRERAERRLEDAWQKLDDIAEALEKYVALLDGVMKLLTVALRPVEPAAMGRAAVAAQPPWTKTTSLLDQPLQLFDEAGRPQVMDQPLEDTPVTAATPSPQHFILPGYVVPTLAASPMSGLDFVLDPFEPAAVNPSPGSYLDDLSGFL